MLHFTPCISHLIYSKMGSVFCSPHQYNPGTSLGGGRYAQAIVENPAWLDTLAATRLLSLESIISASEIYMNSQWPSTLHLNDSVEIWCSLLSLVSHLLTRTFHHEHAFKKTHLIPTFEAASFISWHQVQGERAYTPKLYNAASSNPSWTVACRLVGLLDKDFLDRKLLSELEKMPGKPLLLAI